MLVKKAFTNAEFWDVYADFYDYFDGTHKDDIDFYVDLVRQYKNAGPILEIACGTGRITKECAKIGASIVGLDFSYGMLKKLRKKIKGADYVDNIELFLADMRNFSLSSKFQLIICPFRAFNSLETPEDRLNAFKSIFNHLCDGGLFVFNVFYPENVFVQRESEKPRRNLDELPFKENMRINYDRMISEDLAVITKILEFDWQLSLDIIFRGTLKSNLYRIEKDELYSSLSSAGFNHIEIYESFKKEISKPDTSDFVIFAQKK